MSYRTFSNSLYSVTNYTEKEEMEPQNKMTILKNNKYNHPKLIKQFLDQYVIVRKKQKYHYL